MHIHMPKAVRSLREFLGEISVIVVGILIALTLEQGIEAVRGHLDADDTDRALQTEVRTDLGEALQLAMPNACLRAQIADLTQKLTAPGQTWKGEYQLPKPGFFGGKLAMAAPVVSPPNATMTHNLWDSPSVTRGLSHMSIRRAHRYSDIYRYVNELNALRDDMLARSTEIQPLAFDQSLDSAARHDYLLALARLDFDVALTYNLTGFLMERARQNGIEPDPKDVSERLAFQRRARGDCAEPYTLAPGLKAWAEKLESDGNKGLTN